MWKWFGVLLPVLLVAAGQGWKDKQAAQWSDEDATEVVTDSPWTLKVQPTVERPSGGGHNQGGGHSSRGGMGGHGGGGMGMPGGTMGIPRTPGEQGRQGGQQGGERRQPATPGAVTVRWESAQPVQEAHLKLKETDAPTMDEGNYAVVVQGVPSRFASQEQAKPKAELKRKGQKTIKASAVKVIPRDELSLIVFYFPRSKEIVAKDQQVDFKAEIGYMKVETTFDLSTMIYAGKLEL